VDADAGEEGVKVAGDADGHHGHDGDVFEQQVPADEPANHLAQGNVSVGIGGAGAGNHARELCVGQRGRRRGEARDQERDQHRGPHTRVVAAACCHQAGKGEDADADDAAYANGRQLPQSE
jgi:hypothetical protein